MRWFQVRRKRFSVTLWPITQSKRCSRVLDRVATAKTGGFTYVNLQTHGGVKTPVILPQFHALIEVRMHSIVPILYRRSGVLQPRRKLSLPRYL